MPLTIIPELFKSFLKFCSNISTFVGAISDGSAASGVPSLLMALLALVPFVAALVFFILLRKKRVIRALITVLLVVVSGGLEYLFSFRSDLVPGVLLTAPFIKAAEVIFALALSLIVIYIIHGMFHRKSRNRLEDDDDEYYDDDEEDEYEDEEPADEE